MGDFAVVHHTPDADERREVFVVMAHYAIELEKGNQSAQLISFEWISMQYFIDIEFVIYLNKVGNKITLHTFTAWVFFRLDNHLKFDRCSKNTKLKRGMNLLLQTEH